MKGEGSEFYKGPSGKLYQESVHGDALDSPSLYNAKSRLARYRYFHDVAEESRILEFGVGVGTNLARLPQSVREGFDVGEFARIKSREHGIRVYDDVSDIPRSAYDVVLCRHVLEHVDDPVATLHQLKSFIAPGGSLLLILPVEKTDRYVRRLPSPDINNHLFAWGPQHIVNLLRVAELSPVRHRFYWYSMQAKLHRLSSLTPAYSALVSLAGFLRRQRELAVWAVPRDD